MIHIVRLGLVAAVVLSADIRGATAQPTLGEGRRLATRAELEEAAKLEEQAATTAPDAKTREKLLADVNAIRQRLKNGDFIPGDRILLQVYGDTVLTDTFTVRADRRLRLPNLPDISLEGVLASELRSHLTQRLSVYLKDARVDATGLVRLAVTGSVGKPGFMTVPVDKALTDVIMDAGGPASSAALDHVIVKRGGHTVVDAKGMQTALRLGKTVGDLSVRDGDELFIPDRSQWVGA
jgi:protein involved in polysaccharide export with SLBB domain